RRALVHHDVEIVAAGGHADTALDAERLAGRRRLQLQQRDVLVGIGRRRGGGRAFRIPLVVLLLVLAVFRRLGRGGRGRRPPRPVTGSYSVSGRVALFDGSGVGVRGTHTRPACAFRKSVWS